MWFYAGYPDLSTINAADPASNGDDTVMTLL